MSVPAPSARPLAFGRRADRRVLTGVAGGFADQHGVDAGVVRAGLVLLALAGGLGVLVYAIGYAWSADPDAPVPAAHPRDLRRSVAFVFMVAGAALLVRATGLWIGDTVMIPLAVVGAGVAVIGARQDAGETSALLAASRLPEMVDGRYTRLRLTGGAVLVAVGLVLLGGRKGVAGSLRYSAIAAACTIVGVALVFGPWIARTAQEVTEERRRRIRSEERAEMAAHLHDSVLQTLALIQRNADDPRRTVTLARRQERELRSWLYGAGAPDATLAAAVRTMVEDVETLHDVRVDVVVVGDRPLDEAAATVLAATREATVNAAKHAGVAEVSVYVEAHDDAIEAYVRDRGQGFDRATVAADRKGISESIEGRIERAGGTVHIETGPGTGTEVHIALVAPVEPLAQETRS
jgi:signal transduction histidine kinase/phage shock protein PspC (stress-responsive transcriptional regulator)